jgi:hypothetical protein
VHVALRCKFIPARGVTIDPAQGFTGFAVERYMRYTSDTIGRHAIITGIAESYQGEQNLQRSSTFQHECFDGSWVGDFSLWPSAITVISERFII